MEQRRVGRSGLTVSRLGLGTMTWGTETDPDEAAAQLVAFRDAGGTLVDTAASYGLGQSEVILGGLIADVVPRSELVIATKAGIRRTEEGRFVDCSRGALLGQLDDSLRKLGHRPPGPLVRALRRRHGAVRGDAGRARLRRHLGQGALRRGVELRGLAARAGGGLAAGGARTRADRGQPGAVLPASTAASSARSCPACEALGVGHLPVVAAGRRPADRQVPRRHPVRLAARPCRAGRA